MDRGSPFFCRAPWVTEALDSVRDRIQAELPEALHSLPNVQAFAKLFKDPDPLRPYLLLTVARHYGCDKERAVRLATSIHMIHAASLLHERLGEFPGTLQPGPEPSPQRHQNESMDILLGDLLFSKAACIIIEDGERSIVEDMIRTSLASAETQAMIEGMAQTPESMGPSRCFQVLSDKLSLILALSLRVGAALGAAPTSESKALSEFGVLFGKALRVAEDLRFWFASPATVCRVPLRARFHQPMLLLWEQEGERAWKEIADSFCRPDAYTWEKTRLRLEDTGCLKASVDRMKGFAEEAVAHLDRQECFRAMNDLRELVRVQVVQHGLWEGEVPE